MDDHLGRRAEDAAPRSSTPCGSGRPERVRPRKRAQLPGPPLRLLPRNSAKQPTQVSTARLVRPALCQQVANVSALHSAFTSATARAPGASLGSAFAVFRSDQGFGSGVMFGICCCSHSGSLALVTPRLLSIIKL